MLFADRQQRILATLDVLRADGHPIQELPRVTNLVVSNTSKWAGGEQPHPLGQRRLQRIIAFGVLRFYFRHEALLWVLATPAAVLGAILCWVGGALWAAYFFVAVAVFEALTLPLRLRRARSRGK
jgi:hypothetical protein